jgi:peptidyl-prolyl cis-trans isomerase D
MMLAFTNSDDSSAQQGGDLGSFGPNGETFGFRI